VRAPREAVYYGHFARLIPGRQVVEVLEFETSDPQLAGSMKMTTSLLGTRAGTNVIVLHEGLPPGGAPADNELGTRMALAKLAQLVE
jgi:hypothetical protein